MNAGVKLGAFGLLLVAVFGGGAGLGVVAGPIDVGEPASHQLHETADDDAAARDLLAGGLLVSQDGYTFAPADRTADAGPFAFTITGPNGHPVESYELLHDRQLHLIIASRDLQHYLHLHPRRDERGRWSADLPALAPGAYRAFADFRPTGTAGYVLGVDLTAPGEARTPEPLRARATDSVDGYDVVLDRTGTDHSTEATVTVRRNGKVVTTERYLGAAGHLVALRDGDLAYLHVHPLDPAPAGPVRFAVEVPGAGTYALFFDFRVDGVVRTASFVVHDNGH